MINFSLDTNFYHEGQIEFVCFKQSKISFNYDQKGNSVFTSLYSYFIIIGFVS